ncbi:DUF4249 domain-containing protein [Flavobacterium foetidum]|uniref:DUF4249 domain-containing protein n=1 Tax=Flavobacterium foetidum TaxID=2026681 RepID=UPI001075515C|nr:DUF4249 domain-containing protein [Flavobacterium foetidum]KAF2515963.1 DUF4249 domain-containing protein [Flavobacterium foetidum]
MKTIILFRVLITLILASIFGCTTPYAYQTNEFEDLLVVEATITNQLKYQTIKMSRTYTLEESTPKFEKGATVYVTDDLGNRYDFEEALGEYRSINQFQAGTGREYQLHIIASNGKSYVSNSEKLPHETQIDNVQANAVTKKGELGVEITVNSTDPTNSSKYYRYEYDEAYKVVVPKYYPQKAVVVNNKIELIDRTEDVRTCYQYQKSNELLITNTSKLSDDKVINFPIKFIDVKNSIIRTRYSILVKQYVQNLAAYTYFETMQEISNSGSILSQTQPGFNYGNLKAVDNPGEKVIGFFDVSSYSEKRLFFNFTDLFPRVPIPEFPFDCPVPIPDDMAYQYMFSSFSSPTAILLVQSGTRSYFPTEGPSFILYDIQCGDCTSFASNIKPSFWID